MLKSAPSEGHAETDTAHSYALNTFPIASKHTQRQSLRTRTGHKIKDKKLYFNIIMIIMISIIINIRIIIIRWINYTNKHFGIDDMHHFFRVTE